MDAYIILERRGRLNAHAQTDSGNCLPLVVWAQMRVGDCPAAGVRMDGLDDFHGCLVAVIHLVSHS